MKTVAEKVAFTLGQILGGLWVPVRTLLKIVFWVALVVGSVGFWLLVIEPWVQSWNLEDKIFGLFLITMAGFCWLMQRLERRLIEHLESIERKFDALREERRLDNWYGENPRYPG